MVIVDASPMFLISSILVRTCNVLYMGWQSKNKWLNEMINVLRGMHVCKVYTGL